jgi:hypothetical protein
MPVRIDGTGRRRVTFEAADPARTMTFLNPLLLLGLVAAAIPLIIHLFNFRRPKRIEFSSLAFLREVQRSTMQRVRIKQWLLLLLRTLAIAALVLSFARPTLEGGLAGRLGGRSPASVAIVVDDTPSMGQRDAGGAYFDQALDAARAVASATDGRDEVFLVRVGGRSGQAAVGMPGGQAATERIGQLEQSPFGGTLVGAIDRAAGLLRAASQPVTEMYVISDLQATMLADSTDRPAPVQGQVRIVPVGSRTDANVAVTDVRITSRIVEPGQPVRVEAVLVNHGTGTASAYVASVVLDGERAAQASADLPPGIPVVVPFVVTPRGRGWLPGRVETEDDDFPLDNVRHFALYVPEARRLLVVDGSAGTAGYLRRVFSERLTGDRLRFDVVAVPESRLPAEDLSAYDVVLLGGPVDFTDGEVDRIARFVSGGGGLFWFAGDGSVLDDYNLLLAALGAGRVEAVTSGTQADPIDAVERTDLAHPLFQGVLEGGGRSPERPTLYRRMTYRPGTGTENTVMGLAGGTPFLQEIRSGRGSVLFMASAVDPAWTDLPTRGLFVPLMYRSVFLLSSAGAVSGESYVLGRGGELLLPGPVAEQVQVRTPGGELVTPARRDGAGGTLLRLDELLTEPGAYAVEVGGRVIRRVVANPDPRESDLARMEPPDAVDALGTRFGIDADVLGIEAGDPVAARAAVTAQRQGVELWNVFMGLALLFLVLEMIVARHWRPESVS